MSIDAGPRTGPFGTKSVAALEEVLFSGCSTGFRAEQVVSSNLLAHWPPEKSYLRSDQLVKLKVDDPFCAVDLELVNH